MSENLVPRPLKVCSTCRYWVYRYKGVCTRLGQGVGKFWICEDWVAREDAAPAAGSPAEASVSAPPHP